MTSRSWIRRRGTARSGFRYTTEGGTPVRSAKVLQRIDALAIPPAYRDVHIAVSARAAIQAWGIDARGRRQYRYHPRAIALGERRKFHRVVTLGHDLPAIRAAIARDLRGDGLTKERVAAAVLRLISEGYLRIGEDRYERENHTFGATTLHKTHVTVHRGRVTFEYPGKRSIAQRHEVTDRTLAPLIAALKRTPGRRLFRYQSEGGWFDTTSRDVNRYLRSRLRVPYTAKDFRTWGGTLRCATALAAACPADGKRRAKRNVLAAVQAVAETLGNTPVISRKSYVHPIVIAAYLDRGITIGAYLAARHGALRPRPRYGLTAEETALVAFLDEYFPDRRRVPRDG